MTLTAPDAAGLAIGALDTALSVDVLGAVPNPRPAAFVTVRLGGGEGRTGIVTDQAVVLVEAWADTDPAAHDLAQQARGVLWGLAGTTVSGVRVYRVVDRGAPANLPDPLSAQPRFVFSVQLQLRLVASS